MKKKKSPKFTPVQSLEEAALFKSHADRVLHSTLGSTIPANSFETSRLGRNEIKSPKGLNLNQ